MVTQLANTVKRSFSHLESMEATAYSFLSFFLHREVFVTPSVVHGGINQPDDAQK